MPHKEGVDNSLAQRILGCQWTLPRTKVIRAVAQIRTISAYMWLRLLQMTHFGVPVGTTKNKSHASSDPKRNNIGLWVAWTITFDMSDLDMWLRPLSFCILFVRLLSPFGIIGLDR